MWRQVTNNNNNPFYPNCCLVMFYNMSTMVGYVMPNAVYT